MFLFRRMKCGNRFGNSVTGLDDLLPGRKVFADDDVQIRDLVKHDAPPTGIFPTAPGRTRTRNAGI
jgi:hypothetical protein